MKFPERSLEGNIPKIYLLGALHAFFVSIPVIVLFWKANGLSMFQVTILQALFAVAVIGLEVPSGYFADRYGRRRTLLIASVFAFTGILIYSLGSSFLVFLAGEFSWAVGVSMISGADSALFYDSLVELGREDEYQELWGKKRSYYMLSTALASVMGGFVASFELRMTLFLQLPFLALMAPTAYLLKETEHHKDIAEKEEAKIKAIMTDLVNTPKLRNLILYGAFIYASLQTVFWFYQPYLELSGLDVVSFGILYAGFNVVSAGSSKYAHKIEDHIGKSLMLVSLTVLMVASLALMSSFVFVLSFAFIGLQQVVRGFSKTVISDYVNGMVSSERRSTVLSTQSLLGRFIQAAGMPIFGLLADFYTLQQTLSLMALTVLLGGAVLLTALHLEEVISLE